MQILSAQIYKTDARLENWMFLRLQTDSGLEGWGEISSSPMIQEYLVSQLKKTLPRIMGRNPLNVEACTSKAYEWSSFDFGTTLLFSTAASGINQAVWDIAAKAANQPLWQLLGGTRRDIPLYANVNRRIRSNYTQEALAEICDLAYKLGLHSVKIAPFLNINPQSPAEQFDCEIDNGLQRIGMVCEAHPWDSVMIDCHNRFTKEKAYQLLRGITDHGYRLRIVEDLLPYTMENHMTIRQWQDAFDFQYCAGETLARPSQLKDVICSGAYQFVNPDVKFLHGVSGILEAIQIAQAQNVCLGLHNPTGPISTAFSAHLMSCCENGMELEYAVGFESLRESALDGNNPASNGCYVLGNEPGIGITLCENFLKEKCQLLADIRNV